MIFSLCRNFVRLDVLRKRKILCFFLSYISSFVFADGIYPLFRQWFGFVLIQIKRYHDGGTDAFYFFGFHIDYPLDEVETFSADFRYGRLYGNPVRCKNLSEEVCFDVNYYNTIFFPIYSWADRSEIFCFSKILK